MILLLETNNDRNALYYAHEELNDLKALKEKELKDLKVAPTGCIVGGGVGGRGVVRFISSWTFMRKLEIDDRVWKGCREFESVFEIWMYDLAFCLMVVMLGMYLDKNTLNKKGS